MTSAGSDAGRDDTGHAAPLRAVAAPRQRTTDPAQELFERHVSALGRLFDTYLDAVARELHLLGVCTGARQHTAPTGRLVGSIVLDCTELRAAATAPTGPDDTAPDDTGQQPQLPLPVVAVWDERNGWCIGLHDDATRSSRRYLEPELLPAPATVAEFVVGLALGTIDGATRPSGTPPRLRLIG